MKTEKVIDSYWLHAKSRGLSQKTLDKYLYTLARFAQFAGDVPFVTIGHRQLTEFLASYENISNRTRADYYAALGAFYSWATADGILKENPMKRVSKPKSESVQREPFSKADIMALLGALQSGTNIKRNTAIIYMLLDTGIRAGELCNLKQRDYDTSNKELRVIRGKGGKSRTLPISAKTVQKLSVYLRSQPIDSDRYLFTTNQGDKLRPAILWKNIQRLGKRAGVEKAHPHRFRHTYAIEYLRNGGNVFALRESLGHSDLEMTMVYVKLAQADIREGHKTASPVLNMLG